MNSVNAALKPSFWTKSRIEAGTDIAGTIAVITIITACVFSTIADPFVAPESHKIVNPFGINKTLALAITGTIAGISGLTTLVGMWKQYFHKKEEQTKEVKKITHKQAVAWRANVSEWRIVNHGSTISFLILGIAVAYILSVISVYGSFDKNCLPPDGSYYTTDDYYFSLWFREIKQNMNMDNFMIPALINFGIMSASGISLLCLSVLVGHLKNKKILKSGANHVKEPEEL